VRYFSQIRTPEVGVLARLTRHCLEGNFRGRMTGAQMMSGNPTVGEWLGFMDPGITNLVVGQALVK